MSTDNSLIIFKAISNFTNDLGDVFASKHRPLKLYAHLVSHTTLANEKPIQKHIEAFRQFCIDNREAIYARDTAKVRRSKIVYSEKVYINMKEIFSYADAETREVIWRHILTISALVDPAGKAKEVLREQATHNGTGDEANFLADIISKVENTVDPNSNNPMEAINAIMQSGVFTDLVQGMGNGLQDGSLDIGKLMGVVQNVVVKLSAETGDQEGSQQAVHMVNTMFNSMKAATDASDGSQMPDLASMLGPMMGAMMTNAMSAPPTSGSSSIDDRINAELAAAKASGKIYTEDP
jgi:hypothetical protein